jgi:hypothetical protein
MFEPPRAARETLAMVVPASHLAAVAIEHDERRRATLALPARLVERVGRKVGVRDGRGGHGVLVPQDPARMPNKLGRRLLQVVAANRAEPDVPAAAN